MGEEEVPDGGTVSTPSIKYSSYLKVAFIDRGSDTVPPSTGIIPTHYSYGGWLS